MTWLAALTLASPAFAEEPPPHCPATDGLTVTAHVAVDGSDKVSVTQSLELALPSRKQAAMLPLRLPSEGTVVDVAVTVDGKRAKSEQRGLDLLVAAAARRPKTRTVTVSYTLVLPLMDAPRQGRRNAHLETQWLLGDPLVQVRGYTDSGEPRLTPPPPFSDDHAGYLANWHVTVDAPEGYRLIGPHDDPSETEALTLLGARELGFVLCSDCMEHTHGGTSLWAKHSLDFGNIERSNERAAVIGMSRRGITHLLGPTPDRRLHAVAVRGAHHWGMELPGLIFVEDDPDTTPFSRIDVHEVAHQWWYDDVGANTHEHAWLDEGLTSWTTYHVMSRVGVPFVFDGEKLPLYHLARLVDDVPEQPLVPPPAPGSDWGSYHRAVYAKPVAFFETLNQLDPDGMGRALRALHTTARCTELTPEVLHDTLMAELDPAIEPEALWQEWVYGSEAHTAWIEAMGGRLEPNWPEPDP